jgi:two-component system sensor histidine kinase KdpD
MGGFTAGLIAGCLLGVCGTFLMLSIGAAFSADRARVFRVRSLPGTLLSTIVLLCIAAFCHRLNIGKDASMLLLLLAVLAISKLEGLLSGLIATAIAALILVFWFFPPVGTMLVKSSSDRLALALFLLIATLGSRLIGRQERSAS